MPWNLVSCVSSAEIAPLTRASSPSAIVPRRKLLRSLMPSLADGLFIRSAPAPRGAHGFRIRFRACRTKGRWPCAASSVHVPEVAARLHHLARHALRVPEIAAGTLGDDAEE